MKLWRLRQLKIALLDANLKISLRSWRMSFKVLMETSNCATYPHYVHYHNVDKIKRARDANADQIGSLMVRNTSTRD